MPLLIWNSPEPAAGLAFGKAASRPVKPARGSASRFAPPPHHQAGFRKGPLRRKKRASESGPFRRSRKRPPTHPSRGAPAGRLPRPPLRFPATSPVDPARRMENQKKEPTEGTHPQAGRGLVPACSGRRDRGLSVVRSCFLADAKKQGWGLTPGQAAGGAGHAFFHSASLRKKKHRAVRSARQNPRQSRPSLAGPVTGLAASPSDK